MARLLGARRLAGGVTIDEFRAWLAGFERCLNGAPSPWQWAKIKDRIAEINGIPLPYGEFRARFFDPYAKFWKPALVSELGGVDESGHYMNKARALTRAGEIEGVACCFDSRG